MATNIDKLTPAIAVHPGEYLKDELEAREIKQQDFALLINMKKSQLNEVIKGKRPINIEMAELIGAALQMDAEIWVNLQKGYDLDKVKLNIKLQQQKADIELWQRVVKDNIPVSFLKKQGLLSGNPSEDIPKVKSIYGIGTFDAFGSIYSNQHCRFRKSTKLVVDEVNLMGWVKVVEYKAADEIVQRFDHNNYAEVLDALKTAINRNHNLKVEAQEILKDAGIKLVYQDKPERTPVDGISFWSKGNPAIGLSLRHNRIDNFAFTLFHELGHVYLHLVNNNQASFIDILDGEDTKKVEEAEADEFATNNLINPEDWEAFQPYMQFNDKDIIKFADDINIHPAIVRGRISHEMGYYGGKTKIDYSIK